MAVTMLSSTAKRALGCALAGLAAFVGCGDDTSSPAGGAGDSPPTVVGSDGPSSVSVTLDASDLRVQCSPNVAECVSERIARVCPPDGAGFIAYECGSTESCVDGTCTGGCTAGTVECVGDRISRVCDGSQWVATVCGAGETCADGSCQMPTVDPVCTPGAVECLSGRTVRTCDPEGASWVAEPCGANDVCVNGTCELDLQGAECTPGESRCVDSATALRCLDVGRGYEQIDCPSTASCEDGVCRGAACAIGESRCRNTFVSGRTIWRVQTCVDGMSWREELCASNQRCVGDFSGPVTTAACAADECFNGQTACGDPSDPAVDPTRFYSECQILAGGARAWVTFECAPTASCDPASSAPCTSECTPGEQRCADQFSYQECDASGNWQDPIICAAGSLGPRVCSLVEPTPGTLPRTQCVEEVCGFLRNVGETEAGVCDGGQIVLCGTDGALASTATDCASGICAAREPVQTIGGYVPATCRVECMTGEEQCVSDGLPLFQTCVNGAWSTTYQSCSGTPCQTLVDSAGVRSKICGGECTPGESRCSGNDIQTCTATAQWTTPQECALGICVDLGGNAICRAECAPGDLLCLGDPVTASDGASRGTDAEGACTSRGMFPATPTACTTGSACRLSGSGAVVGCIECIGDLVPGGNDSGTVDSRCTSGELQLCGANDAWLAPTACPTNEQCFSASVGSCLPCFFGSDTCSESTLPPTPFGGGASCQTYGLGFPVSCGGVSDCCSSACTDSGGTVVSFCAPADFSACLNGATSTQLASSAPQTVGGTTVGSSDRLSAPCGASGGIEVVYHFTAPVTDNYVFDTVGSAFDTILYALDPFSCTRLACNDDIAPTGASQVTLQLNAGQTVLIVVDGAGTSQFGTFTLSVGNVPSSCGNGIAEANEECDQFDLKGESCNSLTLGARPFGFPTCTGACTFDISGCISGVDGGGGAAGGGGSFP